jgi:anthranilate synthase component 1
MITEPVLRPLQLTPPMLLALHAANPQRYPALLESAATGEPLGRFDILFAHPGARLTLDATGLSSDDREVALEHDFLATLDRWWSRERTELPACDIPFTGGWLLFLGYELAAQIEPRLHLQLPASGPIAQALRIPVALIYEHASAGAWIVAEPGCDALIEMTLEDIARTHELPVAPAISAVVQEDPAQTYIQAVEGALEHIAAGDIYQANLSRGWHAKVPPGIQPYHLYQRLRQTNPGPFCALAVLEGVTVVSSSPERLVQVRNGWAATRPIAGTSPRGADAAADLSLINELRQHPKERAEHIMLIDLERNDLGRVCAAGTVHVDELMTIESYTHVHHIVSNVRGRLRDDVTPGQVLAAVFPGGTITGCPKVRCMEIIAELEQVPRGAYTGSLGYLNRDGSMDTNILIRSMDLRGDSLSLRAGAGIVADSVPLRELDEARAKARGVLRALGDSESLP